MPMKYMWGNSFEAILDLFVDDYYQEHPNRKALLSADFTHVGIACNCHARLGAICVFELAEDPQTLPMPKHPEVDNPRVAPPREIERAKCVDICMPDPFKNYPKPITLTAFDRCCSCVCKRPGLLSSVSDCRTFNPMRTGATSRMLEATEVEEDEFLDFYLPFSPECPDDKYWDECSEVMDDGEMPPFRSADYTT